MDYKTILVHLQDSEASRRRVTLALPLAAAFEARLVGLHVLPSPVLPAAYGEAATAIGPDFLEAQRQAAAEVAARLREGFEAACGRAGVAHEFRAEEMQPAYLIAQHARYADLTVVGQSEASGIDALAAQLPERVILTAGGPVLVVPYAGRFEALPERPLVAWNGSREAARAVHDALPLLARAKQVTVLEIDPEDGQGRGAHDLAAHLAHHGVEVTAEHTISGDLGPGDVLLSHLADRGCDLLVMGAYGHSRVRELALGGATREVLGQMTVPVLFAY
jgi:nucleotide-binding universal stress UspA family protein